jgi:hypothetical protein
MGCEPACQGGGDGSDIDRRGCRSAHCRRVRLCR